MFELLTGRQPFSGIESAVAIALKHLQSEIPSQKDGMKIFRKVSKILY